jgi:enoyl-CoA hydratase/carnithine racemase
VQVIWPLLLGPNRGRYFLLTGQEIDAREALTLGVVGEVVPHAAVLARALELAREFAARPLLTLRYSRVALTQELRRAMEDGLGYGLALEGHSALDQDR